MLRSFAFATVLTLLLGASALPAIARRNAGATAGPHAQEAGLPGGPPVGGARATPADALDAYFTGIWHLAQATGRASCHTGELTPELRTLTRRDFDWIQHGMDRHAACGPAARYAVVQPIELASTRVDDLRVQLREIRADYDQLLSTTSCWSGQAAVTARAIATPVFALGEAAAETLCLIASWHAPLPAERAREVLRHVEHARQAAARIEDPSLRAALLRGLAPLSARITSEPGESVYHAVVQIVETTRAVLSRAR